MPTPTPQSPLSDDDKTKKSLPAKKKSTIEPINPDEIRAKIANAHAMADTNKEVLDELAEKTAELTSKLPGKEPMGTRVLDLSRHYPAEQQASAATKIKNGAADFVRDKIQSIYGTKEPDAMTEAAEAIALKKRSKHQEFMYDLTRSGKSLSQIQVSWHNYYTALPDDQKHEVWQEFYSAQSTVAQPKAPKHSTLKTRHNRAAAKTQGPHHLKPQAPPVRRPAEIKASLTDRISAGGRLKPVDHLKSLFFGFGVAGTVFLLVMGVFFNEAFVAPFISPSQSVSATPIIGELTEEEIGDESKIIIPKINLEVPVVFGMTTVEEEQIQAALEDGVVHYAASPEPGEQGNSVIVGHSSNNIFNSGKYKFAFVLLRRLEPGDVFHVHNKGVRYTYKIYDKRGEIPPTEVDILGPQPGQSNIMTLITCDPPGTSINRLAIFAEQITPDPAGNGAATIDVDSTTETLPSNAPSLWSRITNFF